MWWGIWGRFRGARGFSRGPVFERERRFRGGVLDDEMRTARDGIGGGRCLVVMGI